MSKRFKCPMCGGHYFVVVIKEVIQGEKIAKARWECHGEYRGQPCRWNMVFEPTEDKMEPHECFVETGE